MNLKYIGYNLQEAQEEIENILRNLQQKGEAYEHSSFYLSMQHLIHHFNIAWNARETRWEEAENASDENLKKWGEYPTDITLI